LTNAMQGLQGQKSRLYVAPGFTVEGEITQKVRHHARLSTILVHCSSLKGAFMALSEIRQDDGSIVYSGRIFHPESGEAYLLVREDGKYYFQKMSTRFLLVE